MSQAELNRAVAKATGECRQLVRERGFSLATPLVADFDPEPSEFDRYLDWEEVDADRYQAVGLF